MKKYNKEDLRQFIHRFLDVIVTASKTPGPIFTHISDEQFEETDDNEMIFMLAEYSLIKLHTVLYIYGEDFYKYIKNQNNPEIYFGSQQELEEIIDRYYTKLEACFELPHEGDLFSRRKEIITKLYNVDLDSCLFESIENSIEQLRGYNKEVLKNYSESQKMLIETHNLIKGDFEKEKKLFEKDKERYQIIDEKISPLIYSNYQKVRSYATLPDYFFHTNALFSCQRFIQDKEVLSELNTVFSKLYTFMRYAGFQNQSQFFGEESISQKLAHKHLEFLTIGYEYNILSSENLFTYMKNLQEGTGSPNKKKYYKLYDKGVFKRHHLFHDDKNEQIEILNHNKKVSLHSVIEMSRLDEGKILGDYCTDFKHRLARTEKLFEDAYRNEYLYLNERLALLINKLIKKDKPRKYFSIALLYHFLTKNGQTYISHEREYDFPDLFKSLIGFLQTHPDMTALYGGLYLVMQKLSLDELQDIFPRELSAIHQDIYARWQDNMVECMIEFEAAKHPDFLAYFGVKNYTKEKFDTAKKEKEKRGENFEFISIDQVTGKVITDPGQYDHSYTGIFNHNLKDNFEKATNKLKANQADSSDKQQVLFKLLYHALWDMISREVPKDIRSMRWYELLAHQNSCYQLQGCFAVYSFDHLEYILNNILVPAYHFEKQDVFNKIEKIPQHLLVRSLYYISRYQSNSKESMIAFANMIREYQLEKCPVKKNPKQLQEIDFGFKILDFDVQLYPFSTDAVLEFMANSQDNKIITSKIIKLFCEGDIDKGAYDYTKALKTRYLFNDRNGYTHDDLSKHVNELLTQARWKDLLTVLDEFRLTILLPPIQKQLTYSSRLDRVRSHAGFNPNIVFLLHIDRIIRQLMKSIIETIMQTVGEPIPIEISAPFITVPYAPNFIDQIEEAFTKYKVAQESSYKDEVFTGLMHCGVTKEEAEKLYNKEHKKHQHNIDQQIYRKMGKYPDSLRTELEMLLNTILSTHTSNEYGKDKNTTNYDIWNHYRPQILLYFIAVLQQLADIE